MSTCSFLYLTILIGSSLAGPRYLRGSNSPRVFGKNFPKHRGHGQAAVAVDIDFTDRRAGGPAQLLFGDAQRLQVEAEVSKDEAGEWAPAMP